MKTEIEIQEELKHILNSANAQMSDNSWYELKAQIIALKWVLGHLSGQHIYSKF